MKLFMIFTFSLCVLYIQVINGIVINDIVVPDMVTIDDDDSNDNIKLDCDYELTDDPAYLVVKWFMNDKGIYQWIRGNQPAVFPNFKDYIEITPISSDANHEYRGFTLTNPSVEISGTYKCLVQTGTDSKSMEKKLHVVDISNYTIAFDEHPIQNETHLECTVSNVFPKPTIHISSDNDDTPIINADTKITVKDNDYYDAVMTAVAQNTDSKDTFFCYVTFEGLPLNISANAFTSGTGGLTHSCSPLLMLSFVCFSWALSKLL